MDLEGLSPDTIALHAGRPAGPGAPANVSPVMSSTFTDGGDVLYARNGNPTWSAFEEAVGALEGGRCLAFASGMAAENAIIDTLPLGAVVVAPATAYYGTLLSLQQRADRGMLELRRVDLTDTHAVIDALDDVTLLWLESPSNPLLGICDIQALSDAAHERGATVVVDGTFATPVLQRALDLGADLSIHSATKYISGHSDLLMGVVSTRQDDRYEELLNQRTRSGGIPGPFETFLALRGMRTLPVRIERAVASATEIARRLTRHPRVTHVYYPGLPDHPGHELAARQMRGPGAMLSFTFDGDGDATEQMCNSTRLIRNTTSLGGVETTMERRARHPGEIGAPENLVRISVGLEAVDDLWADLDRALSL